MEELLYLLTVRGWLIRLWPQLFFWSAMLVVASPTAHFRKTNEVVPIDYNVWCNWVNFHTLPNAYKIKQINNKANHLLEFEYTLLRSTSTCTRTCTWNSVLVLVLVHCVLVTCLRTMMTDERVRYCGRWYQRQPIDQEGRGTKFGVNQWQ